MSKKLVYKNKDIGGVMTVDIPLGCIIPFASNGALPSGFLLCDGSAVSREMYPDLFSAIGTLYGEGDGETTFNLPNLIDGRFLEGTTSAGTSKSAGLPNIEGHIAAGGFSTSNSSFTSALENNAPTGAFSPVSYSSALQSPTQVATNVFSADFDASDSNPIYGNSTTVQPSSVTVRYIIKAFDSQTRDSALIDITQYANALNQKMTHDEPYTDNFCIIYPNGGSESSPANVAAGNRYIEANPFPGYAVECKAEVYYSNQWGAVGWYTWRAGTNSSDSYSCGICVNQLNDSNIIVQTGKTNPVLFYSSITGNPFGSDTIVVNSAPCRIKVWKIGKISQS